MKRLVVKNGMELPNVVFKTSNVIIQVIKFGTEPNNVTVISNGDSIKVRRTKKNTFSITNNKAISYFPYDLTGYFDNKTTVYFVYYDINCKGLNEASNDISEWVKRSFKKSSKIALIGFSKSATCFYSVASKIENDYFVKLTTIASPFKGTIMCSKRIYKQKKRCKILFNLIHKVVYSNLNVDRDIAPGSKYLKSLSEIRLSCYHKNIITNMTIKNCHVFRDYFLLWTNWCLNLKGDGIIPSDSQKISCDITEWVDYSHESAFREVLKKRKYLRFKDNF